MYLSGTTCPPNIMGGIFILRTRWVGVFKGDYLVYTPADDPIIMGRKAPAEKGLAATLLVP